MQSRVATDYLFFVGLLAGAMIFPLANLLVAGGAGRFIDSCLQIISAPISLAGRLFRKLAGLRQAGAFSNSAAKREIREEEQIKASSRVLRNILLNLTVVIQKTEQAANTSNLALDDVRNTIGRMDVPQDLADAHNLLLRQIDHMISGNTALKKELSQSRESLAVQRLTERNSDPLSGWMV